MNPMLKVSAAVLIAAMSALPALAAVDATMAVGTKADIVPFATLEMDLGHWNAADFDAFAKAKTITVFDTNKLYPAADLKLLADATKASSSDLSRLRSELQTQGDVGAWLTHNGIKLNDVIAIVDVNGAVSVYTYS